MICYLIKKEKEEKEKQFHQNKGNIRKNNPYFTVVIIRLIQPTT